MARSTVPHSEVSQPSFQAMIQVDMKIQTFLSTWLHCDHISSYLARMVSHNRSDSVRYANLFSSAFNELLEIAFRTHHPAGELGCKVSRHGEVDRIELTFPCTPDEQDFFLDAVRQTENSNKRERYMSALSGDLAPSRRVVLLELAVDYNAILRLEDVGNNTVKLVVDLPLEGAPH